MTAPFLVEKYIEKIATVTLQDGGAAFDLGTGQFLSCMDAWSFPKYPGRTVILSPDTDLVNALREFILTNEQLLREPDCWLGTWVNPDTHDFYLDIATSCEGLDEAKKLALEASQRDGRKVVALYHSKQKLTVYL